MPRKQMTRQFSRYGKRRAKNIYGRLRSLVRPPVARKTFFMHLEKCGGTSVTDAIRRHYLTWRLDDHRRIVQLDHEASLAAAKKQDMPTFAYREELLYYFLSQREAAFVTGHFQVSRPLVEAFRDEWVFAIMLREPVRRWISHYFFNRFKSDQHGKTALPIEAYLETPRAAALGQDYVRLLTGSGDYSSDRRPEAPSPAAVEQARSTLDRFHVVGCLEDVAAFSKQFERAVGLPLNIGRKNKNPVPRADREQAVTPAIRERIRLLCAPNLELYHHALVRCQT